MLRRRVANPIKIARLRADLFDSAKLIRRAEVSLRTGAIPPGDVVKLRQKVVELRCHMEDIRSYIASETRQAFRRRLVLIQSVE
jgi:hypothetical protein